MRVLLIPSWYDSPDRPNLGTFFRDQALALQRVGLEVGMTHVEARSVKQLRPAALKQTRFQIVEDERDGFPVVRTRGWNLNYQSVAGGNLFTRLMIRTAEAYAAKHGRPDIIHAHAAVWGGLAAHALAKKWGVPFVITEHQTDFQEGTVPPERLRAVGPVYADAAAAIAVSEPLREKLVEAFGRQDVLIVPNLVDTAYWTPGAPRPETPFTFVGQAHMQPRKAFDLLMRGFARAFPDDPSVRLRLGGEGPMRKPLQELAVSLGIADRVELPGSLPREAVLDSMRTGHVFCLPSLAENFGVVLIEALSTGMPLLATRCGGPEDILTPEIGLLIPPGDEDAIVTALQEARSRTWPSPSVLRASAHDRFSYEAVGGRLKGLYEQILAGVPA